MLTKQEIDNYADIIARELNLFNSTPAPEVVIFPLPFNILELSEPDKAAVISRLASKFCEDSKISNTKYLDHIHINSRMSELLLRAILSPQRDKPLKNKMGITKTGLTDCLGNILLAGAIEKEITKYFRSYDTFPVTVNISTKETLMRSEHSIAKQASVAHSHINDIIDFNQCNIALSRLVVYEDGFEFCMQKVMKVTNYGTITSNF